MALEAFFLLCKGLPAPRELNLQGCLLDRASMLVLQVVLPSALCPGPRNGLSRAL